MLDTPSSEKDYTHTLVYLFFLDNINNKLLHDIDSPDYGKTFPELAQIVRREKEYIIQEYQEKDKGIPNVIPFNLSTPQFANDLNGKNYLQPGVVEKHVKFLAPRLYEQIVRKAKQGQPHSLKFIIQGHGLDDSHNSNIQNSNPDNPIEISYFVLVKLIEEISTLVSNDLDDVDIKLSLEICYAAPKEPVKSDSEVTPQTIHFKSTEIPSSVKGKTISDVTNKVELFHNTKEKIAFTPEMYQEWNSQIEPNPQSFKRLVEMGKTNLLYTDMIIDSNYKAAGLTTEEDIKHRDEFKKEVRIMEQVYSLSGGAGVFAFYLSQLENVNSVKIKAAMGAAGLLWFIEGKPELNVSLGSMGKRVVLEPDSASVMATRILIYSIKKSPNIDKLSTENSSVEEISESKVFSPTAEQDRGDSVEKLVEKGFLQDNSSDKQNSR